MDRRDTLIIIVGEPPPEGKDVDIWELQALRDKVVEHIGLEATEDVIRIYAPTLFNVMVKDFDSLYADLKALLPD